MGRDENETPCLQIRSDDNPEGIDNYQLVVGQPFAIETSPQRHCIGYRNPATGKLHHHQAPRTEREQAEATKDERRRKPASQCSTCLRKSMILPCHLCVGDMCKNPARNESCVQPDNHIVYLASFGPGVIKVGVSKVQRRKVRLTEQGAKAAIIIAQADGLVVRRIENYIKRRVNCKQNTKAGAVQAAIPDRVFVPVKLWAYTQSNTRQEEQESFEQWQQREIQLLQDELVQVFEENIRPRLSGHWYDAPQRQTLDVVPFMPYQVKTLDIVPSQKLRGEIKAIFGALIVLELDTGETVALEAKSLVGYTLRPLAQDEHGEGQLAIAF